MRNVTKILSLQFDGRMKSIPSTELIGVDSVKGDRRLESTSEFRRKYQIKYQQKALALFKQTKYTEVHFVRYVIDGPSKFGNSLSTFWNTIGLTSALIGAISITIALATPSRLDALSTQQDHVLGSFSYQNICRAFYVFWSCASISCIAAVINVTIATVHFDLMAHDEDKLWFLATWGFVVMMLPQVFLVVGCFCCMIGLTLGAMMIADPRTYLTIAGIGVITVILVVTIWLCMLSANKKREAAVCEEVKEMLRNEVDLFIDPEAGDGIE